jgi:large subunit ribosomal protein L25
MISLTTTKRDVKSKTKAEGTVLAVAYGPKFESTPIAVVYSELVKAYNTVGTSGLVELNIEGTKVNALIHSLDLDPVKHTPSHVDFYVPEKGKKVHAEVTLVFTGESDAVKAGGLLVKVLHKVEVEAMPEDLPHDIKVDISKLATMNDDVTVADLVAPKGVTITTPATDVVASIVAPEEEKESAPVDLSAIEVEKKGKKEETEA